MKKTILLLGFLATALLACKQDPSSTAQQQTAGNHADPVILAGHWIAMDFCARANQYGSVLGAMNNAHIPYAYAFEFDPVKPDSVTCFNGVETWALPVKYNKDTLEVQGASQGKSVFLIYHSQSSKEMTLFDGTRGSVKMDRFIKSSANAANAFASFNVALNYNLFGGILLPLDKGSSRDTIIFTPGGLIMKWKEYDMYNVCTGGDCFVAEEAIDVITLAKSNKPGSEKMYGFRYNGTNDTLTFYNLVNTRPDEKFAYEIKGPAFRFHRVPQK